MHTEGDEAAIHTTIIATATTAAATALGGVGRLYVGQKTDQVSTDGEATGTGQYLTPWGVLQDAYWQLDATDTTTVMAVYKDSGLTVPVNDFYRWRTNVMDDIVCADEVLFGNSDLSVIYGAIKVASDILITTRFMAQADYESYLISICATQTVATNIATKLTITHTPPDRLTAVTCTVAIPNNASVEYVPVLSIPEATELSMTIIGNLTNNLFNIIYLEAELL